MKILLYIVLLLVLVPVYAQSDSTLLFAERLGINDIKAGINDIGSQKIISASRSLQAVEDLPFTVYVITKEDIRNNGYNTLTDALKMVPGIRVSQVGSGPDGETFLMRGLRGNSYTKILINNIPIKPIGVKGIPIGAQLPIRQAERIEVIFGPAATLYGADASAGVINIILKESERPLYTKADISFGAEGYNSMNILFGGKTGKGRRVLKYNVFGNYTSFDNRRIYLDYGPLYDPFTYDTDESYLTHPNFLSRDSFGLAAHGSTPHLSRMFGIQASFGAFEFMAINMYRRDHSSLGLNTAAYSYANPLNFIGENIRQFHLAYSRKKKNRAFSIALNFLEMESDENSSYRIIDSEFNQALELAAQNDHINPTTFEEKINRYYDNFITRDRYLYDQKIDLSLEATWNVQLTDHLEWMTGFTPRALFSTSEYFLRVPHSISNEDHTVTIGRGQTDGFEIGTFSQFIFNKPNFNAILGVQYTFSSFIENKDTKTYPRLALLYKVSPRFSIRGFYGSAFRTPAIYFSKNTYTITSGNYEWIRLGNTTLKPEITTSLEGGFRWSGRKNFYADVSIFSAATINFINSGFQTENDPGTGDLYSITLGYFNDDRSFSNISGIQSVFSFKNIIPSLKLDASFHLTLTRGKSLLGGFETVDRIREQPKMINQLKLSISPIKNIFFHIDNLIVSKSLNQSTLSSTFTEYEFLSNFHTMDLSVIGALTDHFQINFKINNVFDTQYAGLSATGTTDDLLWNQQSLRTWQLGFSYRME